ncbi:MAG: metal ABC transporter solute-binding protein, Zn/Mn family [Candidatus Cryosericum sp.]
MTIKPVAMIAQAIVGSSLTIEILGSDTGAARENASELASRSALIFQTGTAVDTWASSLGTAAVSHVKLSAALGSGAPDGAWLSFGDSADMAGLMRDTLDALYPEYKNEFDSRYATLVDQCSRADGRLKQLVWKGSTRAFVAADTIWSAAAGDFGLRIVVQSGLKNLDLLGADAASTIMAWGSGEKTHIAVLNIVPGDATSVDRLPNGLVICRLDPLGTSANEGFVPWLEGQLTLLGSGLGM